MPETLAKMILYDGAAIHAPVFEMPNFATFKIRRVRELLQKYRVGKDWIDPFAGYNSPAEMTNDINPEAPTKAHMDAIKFIKSFKAKRFKGVLLDWPYSNNQYREGYKKAGMPADPKVFNAHYQSTVIKELDRVLMPGGIAIRMDWTAMGFGAGRYKLLEWLPLKHGRMHNATLITVERKL